MFALIVVFLSIISRCCNKIYYQLLLEKSQGTQLDPPGLTTNSQKPRATGAFRDSQSTYRESRILPSANVFGVLHTKVVHVWMQIVF